MGFPALKYIAPDDYLAMEVSATEKHEYYDGQVQAMTGAGENHVRISRNLIVEIGSYLKGKSCEVFGNDYRVTTPIFNSYMYPDVTIVCGPTQKKESVFDTLTNPAVIIEILSPSTSAMDKNYKFLYYIQSPTLKEYMLIDAQTHKVTTFKRQENGSWMIDTIEGKEASVDIDTIGLTIKMADIYYMVN
jgi:Uma2 family endonuclease